MTKEMHLSSQNTVNCYKSFCSVFKFWSSTQIFFPSWNISPIISLVFITYLALVHNYNTIKYIYFISPRQCVGMHLIIINLCLSRNLLLILFSFVHRELEIYSLFKWIIIIIINLCLSRNLVADFILLCSQGTGNIYSLFNWVKNKFKF